MIEDKKEEIIAEIKYFVNYFKNRTSVIDNLNSDSKTSDKLYVEKQTLLVSLLDSLANIRFNKVNYPQLSKRHRIRFVRFLIEYANWDEGKLVSIPFLIDHLKQNYKNRLLYKTLKKILNDHNQGSDWFIASSLDLTVPELNSYASNEKEEEAILYYQHYSILYRYRNYLVHEARKPGYGMEFMSYDKDIAIYHSHINEPALHLLYPMGMLKKIMFNSAENFEIYFIDKLINPYVYVEDTLRF